MDKAPRHRNGARRNAQPREIPTVFATLAANKMRWNTTLVGSPAFSRLSQECTSAEAAIVATRAASPAEVQMKLAMLLEWLDDDLAPSSRLLLQSAIDDLDQPGWTEVTAQAAAAAPIRRERQPKVSVNRSSRPCTVDGVLFPSVTAAAKACGIPYGQLRQMTMR